MHVKRMCLPHRQRSGAPAHFKDNPESSLQPDRLRSNGWPCSFLMTAICAGGETLVKKQTDRTAL